MDETAVAATFAYRYEAEFAQETLRAEGIEAAVLVDDAGGAYAGMSFTQQARIIVRSEDLERARELLAEVEEAPEDTSEDPAEGGD